MCAAALLSIASFSHAAANEPQEQYRNIYVNEEEAEKEVSEEELESALIPEITIVEITDDDSKVKTIEPRTNQEGPADIQKVQSAVESVIVAPPAGQTSRRVDYTPEKVYESVEVQASFPGGTTAMFNWMKKNLQYPENAAAQKIEGRVIVKFVVTKEGEIKHATVLRGVDKELDKAAIRLVKSMPRWNPGQMNGKAVSSYFVLPVTFKLQ